MRAARHVRLARAIALMIGVTFAGEAWAQSAVCANDAPDPYAAGVSFAALFLKKSFQQSAAFLLANAAGDFTPVV